MDRGGDTTVKTLILGRIIQLNVLALNYRSSTLCQNIGVGKFANYSFYCISSLVNEGVRLGLLLPMPLKEWGPPGCLPVSWGGVALQQGHLPALQRCCAWWVGVSVGSVPPVPPV
jgi:hypothetical protein